MTIPVPISGEALLARLAMVVRHGPDCAGQGRPNEYCNCDAMAALDDARILLGWLERERAAWQANATTLYEIASKLADDVRPGWRERNVTPMSAICEAFLNVEIAA